MRYFRVILYAEGWSLRVRIMRIRDGIPSKDPSQSAIFIDVKQLDNPYPQRKLHIITHRLSLYTSLRIDRLFL